MKYEKYKRYLSVWIRICLKNKKKTPEILMNYFSSINRLNKIILIVFLFIAFMFIVMITLLISRYIDFKDIMAPLMISLSAILASLVAVVNMKQNYNIEILKLTIENVSNLKYVAVQGYKVDKQLLYLKNVYEGKSTIGKNKFLEIKKLLEKYLEYIHLKELMIMLDNKLLKDSMTLSDTLTDSISNIDFMINTYFIKNEYYVFDNEQELENQKNCIKTIEELMNINPSFLKDIDKKIIIIGKEMQRLETLEKRT